MGALFSVPIVAPLDIDAIHCAEKEAKRTKVPPSLLPYAWACAMVHNRPATKRVKIFFACECKYAEGFLVTMSS